MQSESLPLIQPVISEHLVCPSHCSKHWRCSTCLHEAYILVEGWGQEDSQETFNP